MGGHGHDHDVAAPISDRARSAVVIALLTLAAATIVGLVALWPKTHRFEIPAQYQYGGSSTLHTVSGKVLFSRTGSCGGADDTTGTPVALDRLDLPTTGGTRCLQFGVAITSGPEVGDGTLIQGGQGSGVPNLKHGQQVRLARQTDPTGNVNYYFYDYARGLPLVLLAICFALLTVLVARLRGLAALLGVGVAFAVIVEFMLPALLSNKQPLLVAVVAGSAILFVVQYLAHGVSMRTSSALLGSLITLGVITGVSELVVHLTHLTGLSNEDSIAVQAYTTRIDLVGLVIAGFIIGGLGVINDLTVTQASAAYELAASDPGASRLEIYRRSMRIGRDHIASTVYTLVLAYAGAALPTLLLLTFAGRTAQDTVTSELVSSEIIRSIVGGVGIALSVPVTTALACLLITRSHVHEHAETAPAIVS